MTIGYLKVIKPFFSMMNEIKIEISDVKKSQSEVITKVSLPSRTDSLLIDWISDIRTDQIKTRNKTEVQSSILKELIKKNDELKKDLLYWNYRLDESNIDSLKKKNQSSLTYIKELDR